mmetsp:Transcript_6860/g.12223  ORF Transcript_6860/g.12223 Transcript_6860/m.12223 type:complete len:714 (+) Transcript_6860:67-2208(+)
MDDEQIALLSGTNKPSYGNGNGATKTRNRATVSVAAFRPKSSSRRSRFGNSDPSGVRPSWESISPISEELLLESMPPRALRRQTTMRRRRRSTLTRLTLLKNPLDVSEFQDKPRGMSFTQDVDGNITNLTPLEMGRRELYEELPFIAVPGLQRSTQNLTIAFSNFAASLDNQEEDDFKSKHGRPMLPEERAELLAKKGKKMLGEFEEETTIVTLPLLSAVFIASLLAFNFGYNISVTNPTEPFVFPGHSISMWSVAVSSLCIGGPIGAVMAGKWADNMGRRKALILASWLYTLGGLVQTLAPNLTTIVAARTVIGVACGATTVLVPIYMGEMAPPPLRGVIGTLTQFAFVTGIFVGDLLGFPLANESLWRYMFLFISVIGAGPLLLKPLLLESPRWLLEKDPDSDEARFTIEKLRGFTSKEQVETEVEHYVRAAKRQRQCNQKDVDANRMSGRTSAIPSKGDDIEANGKHAAEEEGSKNAMLELFEDKSVRLLLVSSLVLQVSSQLSGHNAVFYYSGLFFDGVIDNPLMGTTIMGAVNVLASYVALLLMDRCGRRTLIMWSSIGMLFSCIFIVLSLLGFFGKMASLFWVAAYVMFYEIGLGPIPVLIVAEMFDAKYVATAMSVTSQFNWVCNFIVGITFPYINESLGAYSFVPFAIALVLTIFYTWIWLPETRGTTPAELQAELVKKNATVTFHNMDILQEETDMDTDERLTV